MIWDRNVLSDLVQTSLRYTFEALITTCGGDGSDADGCAAAIVDVSYAAAYGPVLITNNDGGPEVSMPSSKGGTFSPLAAHNTSLAAYLMAMGEESYFGSGYASNTYLPVQAPSVVAAVAIFLRSCCVH